MYRTGIGYDLHRTDPDRALILGGVRVESDLGLRGHSDADVVLHALCDALLGASGLGDIGELFPDSDPAFKDADSRVLMREVVRRVRAVGFELVNVDVVIVAERPRLKDAKPRIRASIVELLGLRPEAVGVQAKTNEGVDAVGRREAIACHAVALLRQS